MPPFQLRWIGDYSSFDSHCAGISTRKPHGIAVLTAVMVAGEPKSSLSAVEKQKVANVRMASPPATGWIYFDHATQIPDTATFWKRCGDATVERG